MITGEGADEEDLVDIVIILQAVGAGECTFKMAQVDPTLFVSFSELQESDLISIPILVANNTGTSDNQVYCLPEEENCALKYDFNITRSVEKSFRIMGM